jgi:hypothetical protein
MICVMSLASPGLFSLYKGALSPSDLSSNIVVEPWFVLWLYGDDLFVHASICYI